MLKRFIKNPILKPDKQNDWESRLVFNPAAAYENSLFHLLYRAVGEDDISRIGYAVSADGYEFFRFDKPVFTPRGIAESKGCEDPRLVCLEGKFFMTYTAYSTKGVRVSLASTNNFIHWQQLRGHLARYGEQGCGPLPGEGKGKVRYAPQANGSSPQHLDCLFRRPPQMG